MAPPCARSMLPLLLALVAAAVIPGTCGAQVAIQPERAFLFRGGSIRVNCSSSCAESVIPGLETQWPKVELQYGHNWKLFELSDIQEDSKLLCFENCGSVQSSASATITVYSFPDSVELDPLPNWQRVGENLTLRCLVYGGAPRSQLSAVLLQGDKELHRETVDVDSRNPKEITTMVLASRDNHGANFSCRTELDLRQYGLGLFLNVSKARHLQTFDLPVTIPKLNSPDLLEVGTRQKVLCSLEGLFPASEAHIYLELGNRTLTHKSTNHGDLVSVTALVEVSAELEGTLQLRCVLELANQIMKAERTLNIYSFSAPVLTQSPLEVSEGSQVTVKCEAHGGAQVVKLDGAHLPRPGSPQVNFTLKARAEDDKRVFSCSVALEVAGKKLFKSQSLELRVLYGPRLDERDCLGNWTWPEGTRQTLKCQAWGNPSPNLTCTRKADEALLPIGVVETVTCEMNGTYTCHAESPHGNVTRTVFITVFDCNKYLIIVILVTVLSIVLIVGLTFIYFYNRQRKIRKYKLQRTQEEAAKLKAQAPPP